MLQESHKVNLMNTNWFIRLQPDGNLFSFGTLLIKMWIEWIMLIIMQRLTSLSREAIGGVAEQLQAGRHSGTNDPQQDWLDSWFGSPKKNFAMGALLAFAVLIFIGCCCIPCARSFCTRIIHTAVGPQSPTGMQMHLLVQGDKPNDNWEEDEDEPGVRLSSI